MPRRKKQTPFGLPNASDHPEVDFHCTSDTMPVVYMLGRISIAWNYCEHIFGTLIWHHFGDVYKGMAVTANMGNQSRADLLLRLIKRDEKNKNLVGHIEFAAKAFNRLRETRNVLMHSHGIAPHESGKFEWRRTSRTAKLGHVGSLAGFDDLSKAEANIYVLSEFILEISLYYFDLKHGRKPRPLPEVFEMPSKLIQLPEEDEPTEEATS